MTQHEREKWRLRSDLKSYELAKGAKHISGFKLNERAGLPIDAEWREENFA